MSRPLLLGLVLLVGLGANGCGTFINLGDDVEFYGGVKKDLEYQQNPPLPQDDVGWWWTVDLPLSAFFDTLLIPVYGMRALFKALEPTMDPDGFDEKKAKGKTPEGQAKARRRKARGPTNPSRPAPIRLHPKRKSGKVDPLR